MKKKIDVPRTEMDYYSYSCAIYYWKFIFLSV